MGLNPISTKSHVIHPVAIDRVMQEKREGGKQGETRGSEGAEGGGNWTKAMDIEVKPKK
jgi:hypothetical protein